MSTSPVTANSFVPWLRELAEKGGKGVVNNIDARCLGRVADEIERLHRLAQSQQQPVAWVNGDELANMLDDRTAVISRKHDGWRNTPLYTLTSTDGRPLCRKCGLEDGACICAHIEPAVTRPDGGRTTVWPTGTGNTPQDVQLASLVTRPDGGGVSE